MKNENDVGRKNCGEELNKTCGEIAGPPLVLRDHNKRKKIISRNSASALCFDSPPFYHLRDEYVATCSARLITLDNQIDRIRARYQFSKNSIASVDSELDSASSSTTGGQ